jgi:hypothetical protein
MMLVTIMVSIPLFGLHFCASRLCVKIRDGKERRGDDRGEGSSIVGVCSRQIPSILVVCGGVVKEPLCQ